MISIAIVEDEEMYAKQLQQFLHQYEEENKEMFDITVYSDGDQIVNKYKSQYDIILMDVEMKFMDGMSAAEEIRKIDTEVVIIFITNMAQYAIRGYAVDALDYVLKPVSYFAFSQRLNRAISRMKKRILGLMDVLREIYENTMNGFIAAPVSWRIKNEHSDGFRQPNQ